MSVRETTGREMEAFLKANVCFVWLLRVLFRKHLGGERALLARAAERFRKAGCCDSVVRHCYSSRTSLLSSSPHAHMLRDSLLGSDFIFLFIVCLVTSCLSVQQRFFGSYFVSLEQKKRVLSAWTNESILDVSAFQQLVRFLNDVEWLDVADNASQRVRVNTRFLNGYEHKSGVLRCGAILDLRLNAVGMVIDIERVQYEDVLHAGCETPEEVCLAILRGLHMYVVVGSHLMGAQFLTALRLGHEAAAHLPPGHRVRALHLPTEIDVCNALARDVCSLLVKDGALHAFYPLSWMGLRQLIRAFELRKHNFAVDRCFLAELRRNPRVHHQRSLSLWAKVLHKDFVEVATSKLYCCNSHAYADPALRAWLTSILSQTSASSALDDLNFLLTNAYLQQIRRSLWSSPRFWQLTHRLLLKIDVQHAAALRMVQMAAVAQLPGSKLMEYLPWRVQTLLRNLDPQHVLHMYRSDEISLGS
jgi:hypothetical protein